MPVDPLDPVFHDEDKAREYFEALRWPDGPFCAHCGSTNVHRLEGQSHRAGLLQCNDCMLAFSVTVKSVMESSHIPLTKWAMGFRKMAASKKGISAKQLQRDLDLKSYRTAWFMAMRLREACKLPKPAMGRPIGGEGKVLESDETFVGGKKKNVHKGKPEPKKHAVHALVERGGHLRATHVSDVSAKTLRAVLQKHADPKSALHTDDGLANLSLGKDFAEHKTVNHSADEYHTKDGAGVPSAEAFFAILKRGIMGSFHSISEQHLQRYCDEFAFRWDNRSAMGVEDDERAARMVRNAIGRRLTYRQPDKPQGDNQDGA
jgi:transposase-like protein